MKLGLAVLIGALAAAGAAAGEPEVVVGLLVPDRGSDAGLGEEIRRGAEIAVAAANRGGGIGGVPLRLAISPADPGWEGTSRSLVRLIQEEKAVAVIGALDGRAGHVAEQVIARARGAAIFVTAWASEETLTRVRIPWFFRIVPDDRRQGAALAAEIFSVRGVARAAVWVEDSFDARAAAEAFRRASPPGAAVLHHEKTDGGLHALAASARLGGCGAVVLFAAPRSAAEAAERLRAAGFAGILAGPLWLARPEFIGSGAGVEGALLVAPAGAGARAMEEFASAYRAAWGKEPETAALYGHDAAAVLAQALRAAGPRPPAGLAAGDRLAAALERLSARGLTGVVRFDGNRDRDGSPRVAAVTGGALPAATAGPAPAGGGWRR